MVISEWLSWRGGTCRRGPCSSTGCTRRLDMAAMEVLLDRLAATPPGAHEYIPPTVPRYFTFSPTFSSALLVATLPCFVLRTAFADPRGGAHHRKHGAPPRSREKRRRSADYHGRLFPFGLPAVNCCRLLYLYLYRQPPSCGKQCHGVGFLQTSCLSRKYRGSARFTKVL